jgi:hypothetical protein
LLSTLRAAGDLERFIEDRDNLLLPPPSSKQPKQLVEAFDLSGSAVREARVKEAGESTIALPTKEAGDPSRFAWISTLQRYFLALPKIEFA